MPKIYRRFFILQMLSFLAACQAKEESKIDLEFVIGVFSDENQKQVIKRFANFREYLSQRTQPIVNLEVTSSEQMAIERLKRGSWSLVFATPSLTALGKAFYQYQPILSLQRDGILRSVIVVRQDSSLKELKELQNKKVALGLPGSTTGYYLPLYNLFGLTLAEILFISTPKAILESVAKKQVIAGAVSLQEFNLLKGQFNRKEFRILFSDSQNIPPGAILLSPEVERNSQERLEKILKEAPPNITQEVGYLPNESVDDYKYMVDVVKRVTPLTGTIRSKPARLF